jgi:hypothetical protein
LNKISLGLAAQKICYLYKYSEQNQPLILSAMHLSALFTALHKSNTQYFA